MSILKRIITGYILSSLSVSTQFNYCPKIQMSSSMSIPNEFSIAYVTAPNNDVAKTIAQKLVENKLAACVNIIPGITSIYEWKEKIETDSEVLLMIKTRSSRLEELTIMVKENHPYEVCEVISVPIQYGNIPYMQWLSETVPHK